MQADQDQFSESSFSSHPLPSFEEESQPPIKPPVEKKVKGNNQKNKKMQANKKIKGKIKGRQEESFEMFSRGYKTVPCDFFLKGNCNKGDDCKFRHDVEQKPLDLMCKFFLTGNCHKSNCLYLHDTTKYPCKFLNISGKCDKMTECNFSHERFSSVAQIEDFIKQNLESLKMHRDKGINSVVLKYAIDKGYFKESAELERQHQIGLMPAEFYEGSDNESEEDAQDKRGGGQLDRKVIEGPTKVIQGPKTQPTSLEEDLFMP